MKNTVLSVAFGISLMLGACTQTTEGQPTEPQNAPQSATAQENGAETGQGQSHETSPTPAQQPKADARADFGPHWKAATVRLDTEDGASDGAKAVAVFACEWTDGQGAGVMYPKKFIDTRTGQEVKMNFLWDSGGEIAPGVYDVQIEHDGALKKGWIRGVNLAAGKKTKVTVVMNAAMLDLPLDKYSEVAVYPAGTYADYKKQGKLNSIPADLRVAVFNSEEKGVHALVPRGTFDLHVKMADGSEKWLEGFEIKASGKITALP